MTRNATKKVGDKIGTWTVVGIVSAPAVNPEHTTFVAICEKPCDSRVYGTSKKTRRFDVTGKLLK